MIRDHDNAAEIGIRMIYHPMIVNLYPLDPCKVYTSPLLSLFLYKLQIEHTNIDLRAPMQPIVY